MRPADRPVRLLALTLCLSPFCPAVEAAAGLPATPAAGGGCHGQGALTARLHGAIDREIQWRDAVMRCEGSMRPDGSGLRLTATGPVPGPHGSLRLLLGIAGAKPGANGRNLAANLTLIVGSPGRIFATRGSDVCTVDSLVQQPLPADTAGRPRWRVQARGFCVAPATTLGGAGRILLSRFDLQTELRLEPPEAES